MAEKILLAADHAGVALKRRVAAFLSAQGYEVIDLGAYTEDSVDYPDYGDKLAAAIAGGQAARGIAICGTGIGISIALNRHKHIRAALCQTAQAATLARQHNDANVLVFGARIISAETAFDCVRAFLSTGFEGGRHARRVEKLGSC